MAVAAHEQHLLAVGMDAQMAQREGIAWRTGVVGRAGGRNRHRESVTSRMSRRRQRRRRRALWSMPPRRSRSRTAGRCSDSRIVAGATGLPDPRSNASPAIDIFAIVRSRRRISRIASSHGHDNGHPGRSLRPIAPPPGHAGRPLARSLRVQRPGSRPKPSTSTRPSGSTCAATATGSTSTRTAIRTAGGACMRTASPSGSST